MAMRFVGEILTWRSRMKMRLGSERLSGPGSPRAELGRVSSLADGRGSFRSPRAPVKVGGVGNIHGGHRTLHVNSPDKNLGFKFKNNSVSTTKYSIITFLPKGLFEQFRRVANLYFLLIAILSATPVSPVHPLTNIAPLTIVLAISLLKEAFEDRKRYISDCTINSTKTEVLEGREWVSIPWSQVKVGDILRVQADQYFPADLLCLATMNPDGICYIETMNLDGETNLKIRKALERTWDYISPEAAAEFRGATVECEQPNNSLYTFTGNLIIGKQTIPITPNQILLRGCSLRNTEYLVGAVIFTGHETKVMMNAMDVPSKRSTLERRLDSLILLLFLILFCICLIGAIGSAVFSNRKYWFLALEPAVVDAQNDPSQPLGVLVLRFFTLLTLYSTIIPISLYVSIEMIKFIQVTQFVNTDMGMYHKESDTPALARTSNLNEELGQIEYIFSDKTGTLTRNMMEFFKCSIGGVMYGTGITEIQRATAARTGQTLEEDVRPEDAVKEKGFNFHDRRLMKGAWRNEPDPNICKEFFRLLAICHTVLPEGEEVPESIQYQAASPDELALVTAAKNFGFFFYRRTPTLIRVREAHVERHGKLSDFEYEILNVLEFNSTRKRQSVICRFPNGRLVLYCKGADTVVYERLAESSANHFKEATRLHLEKFGADGLRTLCLAYTDLDPVEYEAWNDIFISAKSALRDREKKLDEAAEKIEKNLILLGATAIEDKLQEGVPTCIELLGRAGIKIWVLTGDKMETAINIAYACSLLTNEQKHFIISSETDEIRASEDRGDAVETAKLIKATVRKQLEESLDEAMEVVGEGREVGLVIDGRCLMYALDPYFRGMLLKIGMLCKAVVCCRVSPLQKAQVTTLIKDGARKITLSIGDGANDVSMIQAAHIGVGISGQEGMQAVMASDFAIAQFRFLSDLLLVHGRYSYLRLSKVVTYYFYKNLAFTLTQFWFNCYTGYSGQRFYDDWFQSMYNVVFTALPVIVVGILDQDVVPTTSKQFPQLYLAGIQNQFFNRKVMSIWLLFAVYQSLVFFFFPATALEGSVNAWGKTLGIWEIGTASYTIVIITVNIRLMMACSYLTKAHHLAIWGSIGGWLAFAMVYCGIRPGTLRQLDSQDNLFFSIFLLFLTPSFWLVIALGPIAALIGDFLYLSVQRTFYPFDFQIVQEKVRGKEVTDRRLQMEAFGEGPTSMTAEEERTIAMVQLPQLRSEKHKGFSFDTPSFESYFATQEGVNPSAKAWDVARRMSMSRRRSSAALGEFPRKSPKAAQPSVVFEDVSLEFDGQVGGGGREGGGTLWDDEAERRRGMGGELEEVGRPTPRDGSSWRPGGNMPPNLLD